MDGKILIADDDIRVNELLQDIFTMEGCQVCAAFDGEEVLRILSEDNSIDLLILDVMMPVLGGWDVLGYIKSHYDVRVLMLTALDDEASEVRCFQEGADDYVAKPFRRAVLLERARRLIQSRQNDKNCEYRCGELTVNCQTYVVTISGEPIKLTVKEYRLLVLLLEHSGIVLGRDVIQEKVWGYDFDGSSRTLDTHVKMLRRSLGELGSCIRTIRGVGYSFDGEVVKV